MKLLFALFGSIVAFTGLELIAEEPPATFKVSEFTFNRPDAWGWVKPTSRMRAAQLTVGKKDAAAEVVFFYFGPGNGGGTQANIDRWLRQFKEPRAELNAKVEPEKVAGKMVTYVRAEGTYLSGPPFGQKVPKPGHAMMAAIMEGKQGNVFVKMTGPTAVTKAAIPAFKTMVSEALK